MQVKPQRFADSFELQHDWWICENEKNQNRADDEPAGNSAKYGIPSSLRQGVVHRTEFACQIERWSTTRKTTILDGLAKCPWYKIQASRPAGRPKKRNRKNCPKKEKAAQKSRIHSGEGSAKDDRF